MRTRTFVVLLTALLLGIVGTPALLASSGNPTSDRHRGGGHGDDQYRIKEVAYQVEQTSERVLYELKRDRYGRSRSAIEAVYALHECAEDYARAVRRTSGSHRDREMFRGLVRLYNDADYALKHSRNRSAHHELYRVGRLLDSIDQQYARTYRTDRNRDTRRYDERRDNNRGRYDDWRYRGGGGATVVLPRIRLRLPF